MITFYWLFVNNISNLLLGNENFVISYCVGLLHNMTITVKIDEILETNKINDLKRFIEKREKLNQYNIYIRYSYYVIHYSSILATTFAVGYIGGINCEDPAVFLVKELIWAGICLNMISTVLSSFEQMNKTISKKMLRDIMNIKNGNYIDEGDLGELSHKNSDSKIYVDRD